MPEIPFWNELIVSPLTQGLIYLHRYLGSFGLAIIVFTVLIRIVMLPLTIQQLRASREMQKLQPLLGELQRKYARDRSMLAQEQMRLYREHGINPAAGCLPMLLQMPIWFGLYQALFSLSNDPQFASVFLWVPNVAATPEPITELFSKPWPWLQANWWSLPLAVFTGASQWVLQKMMTPTSSDPQQQMLAGMMNFMPIMFAFFAFSVPHGLVLYWAASNVVSLVQQYFFTGWGGLRPAAVVATPSRPAHPARPERPAARGAEAAPLPPRAEAPSPGGIRTYTLEPDAEGRAAPSAEERPGERPQRPPRRKRRRP
ncbi:MAG: membrane protein insertase YidC [Chloroflexi bacterium]|nr:membrane protein insertase YidC [Chloroflexota bacterium]